MKQTKKRKNSKKSENNKKRLIVGIVIFLLLVICLSVILKIIYHKEDLNTQEVEHNEQKVNILKDELVLEVGSELPIVSEYYDNFQDDENKEVKYYLNDKEVTLDELKHLKDVNEYKVIIDGTDETKLRVVDTTKPEVKLQELTITEGDKYDIKSFVLEYKDNSNIDEYVISYKDSEDSSLNKEGTYDIELTICDQYDNCIDEATKLIINKTGSSTNTNKDNNSNSSNKDSSNKNNSNTTSSNNTTNNNTTNKTTSKTPSTTTKKYVKDVTEKVVTKKETKYGTTITHYVNVTYKTYSDGSKVEKSRTKESLEINYKNFNGKFADMKKEAQNIYSSLNKTRTTILNETNKYRKEKNVSDLVLDKDLSMIATIKAIEMAYSNVFAHERPDGRIWYSLHDEYGYKNYYTIAENIAYNYTTDLDACRQWRESSGHYANMINNSMTKIGIGKYTLNGKTYYVQEFAG